ncbi:MAG: hypothetical protein AUJ12_05755 [Alphaproteobacteria bacterium CG1_02_46_17]|nr:MAG: hypothetical protein AUJ12_05755 [Alphaproteobacteria bacterium CG1_02_46_17]
MPSFKKKISRRLLPPFKAIVGVGGAAFGVPKGRQDSLIIRFMSATGQLKDFAARKDWWLRNGSMELAKGNIDPLHFSLMTSAMCSRHEDSNFNRADYLFRVVKLYNAENIIDICNAESAHQGSEERKRIVDASRHGGLEAAKIDCLIRDIEFGTRGKLTAEEIHDRFKIYKKYDRLRGERGTRTELSADGKQVQKTYSAFPKKVLFPLLEVLFQQGKITDEQVSLINCINYHSREHRRNSKESYIRHPMAVAGLVIDFATMFGFSEEEVLLAVKAALNHDIGEKSNFVMKDDLPKIVRDDLRQLVGRLHKEDSEDYFDDYIDGKCGHNRLAALVKLCDIYHNSSDVDAERPSFKQAYVYPIVANFLLYKICNPKSAMGIDDFVALRGICSRKDFLKIKEQSKEDHKVAVSTFAATIPQLNNIIPVQNIFDETPRRVTLDYAHLLRKEDSPLQCRPDV